MNITLTRYHESLEQTRSEMLVDGRSFGEAREPGTASARYRGKVRVLSRLPEGVYQCRIAATELSPMTLKVRRSPGQDSVCIGWDPVAPWRTGYICIGQASPLEPPEERELTDCEGTFRRFTEMLYEAFRREEALTLEVKRCIIANLANQ